MKKYINKLISCFLILLMVTFLGQNIFATNNYWIHIAVFCDDIHIGQSFIDSACKYTYIETPNEAIPLETENDEFQECTMIYLNDIDTKYNIKFHLIPKEHTEPFEFSGLSKLVKNCSGAIVLYDISDNNLNPIVQSNTFYKNDIEILKKLENIPVIYYTNYLQGFLRKGWFNAIYFATYGRDKLDDETYNLRHSQLNRFTCEMEAFYKIDNKWGRGHPDLTHPKCLNYALRWISGASYRSVNDGTVRGDLDDKLSLKKKIAGGILVISGVSMIGYGFYLLNK